MNLKDAYPKVLLANTLHEKYLYKGIEVIDLKDWQNNKKIQHH